MTRQEKTEKVSDKIIEAFDEMDLNQDGKKNFEKTGMFKAKIYYITNMFSK